MIKLLEDFGNDHFLLQHVDFPTHCQGNILDLVRTYNDSLVHSVAGIEPLRSLSHHKILTAATQYKYDNTDKPRDDNPNYISPFNELNVHDGKIEWDIIKTSMGGINWDKGFQNLALQDMSNKFYQLCYHIPKDLIPKRKNSLKCSSSKIPQERRSLVRRRTRVNKLLVKIT